MDTKITFGELTEFLRENHNRNGVIVIKNGPYWNKAYPLESRSYKVSGQDNYFQDGKISNAILGFAIDGSDDGVRLDWYMREEKPEDRWQVDYCYILPEGE